LKRPVSAGGQEAGPELTASHGKNRGFADRSGSNDFGAEE
jgi:hypothetical protein